MMCVCILPPIHGKMQMHLYSRLSLFSGKYKDEDYLLMLIGDAVYSVFHIDSTSDKAYYRRPKR